MQDLPPTQDLNVSETSALHTNGSAQYSSIQTFNPNASVQYVKNHTHAQIPHAQMSYSSIQTFVQPNTSVQYVNNHTHTPMPYQTHTQSHTSAHEPASRRPPIYILSSAYEGALQIRGLLAEGLLDGVEGLASEVWKELARVVRGYALSMGDVVRVVSAQRGPQVCMYVHIHACIYMI
jgi:hypothetical protein